MVPLFVILIFVMQTRFLVPNPKGELKTGTLHAMLDQLGLKLTDL